MNNTKITNNDNIIQPQKFVFWIGLIECVFLLAIPVVFSILQDWENMAITIIPIIVFAPIDIYLMLYGLNWKLIINEDGIIFRNMFGKTKTYSYADITAFKKYKMALKVYIGKKVISIDYYFTDGNPIILLHKLAEMNKPVKNKRK